MKALASGGNRLISDGHVAILLATYNGAEYLPAQLDSLASQMHENWVIYASDDGSDDDTVAILLTYQRRLGKHRLEILRGPRQGYVRNFMSMVLNEDLQADYYAFCDQDDIWRPDRLSRGVCALSESPEVIPKLYCSRTELLNGSGLSIGFSKRFRKLPAFKNALTQSIGGGNTMLFNQAARNVLFKCGSTLQVVSHDWWLYMIVTGAGGRVFYDGVPTVGYRQHAQNLIGSNSSLRDQIKRIKQLFSGRFSDWNSTNILALHQSESSLTSESLQILKIYSDIKSDSLLRRVRAVWKSGAHRQSAIGTVGLYVAAALRKA